MAHVPGFNHDVFISYSHFDNQAVDQEGWVSDFHRRLQIELDEELGEASSVWRDPRTGSADDLTADMTKQLKSTAVLLAIVSPGYLNSRWCAWELKGFVEGERRTGDLWVEAKCRVIKVVKRPGDQNAHRNLAPRETLGIELFETDRASGRNYELKPESEPFQRRLTDLAQDICGILRLIRRQRTVYLGVAPPAMAAQRERVGNELKARQFRVLAAPEPEVGNVLDVVTTAMRESSLSIHFVDRMADGSAEPATAAVERTISSDTGVRQVMVVHDPTGQSKENWALGSGNQPADVEVLVDPPTHALNETVLDKLGTPEDRPNAKQLVRVYLICERQDHPLLVANRARTLRNHLLKRGLEVKLPLAEGDAAEFSRDNRLKLKQCDGVLLYWGGSRQNWFEERLNELTQAKGWRRNQSFSASAAYVADPLSPVKENYETREVEELIKQFDELDVNDDRLLRFIARLEQTSNAG
jgi:hypothetical protein